MAMRSYIALTYKCLSGEFPLRKAVSLAPLRY